MKVVFRVDSSINTGSGHVMRCMALAESLNAKRVEVNFICRKHEGNLNAFIANKKYKVFELPNTLHQEPIDGNDYSKWLGVTWQQDADETTAILKRIKPDYIIVDNYSLDSRWENVVKHYCKSVVVIDDLANREHECEILVDQTLGRVNTDYNKLVPEASTLLLGVDYALLRGEFALWRPYSLSRRHTPVLKNILVSLGGVDKDNMTVQIMDALNELKLSIDKLTVIMGNHAPHISAVNALSKSMSCETRVLSGVGNMAELMAKSDLVIGAAGSSSWERSCLGVPSIALVIADNQKTIAEQLTKKHMAIVVSHPINENMEKVFNGLNQSKLRELASYSSRIVDGQGCERVAKELFEHR